jgi:hypothetical protein
MARTANKFIDPAGVVPTFTWPLNHETEEKAGKQRSITNTAPTGHVGLVKEVNDAGALSVTWKGKCLTKAHVTEMWRWWQLCESRTIFLEDFAGEKYEILIEEFDPVRKAVARNLHDQANAPIWIWEYTFTFSVMAFITGPLADAGVTV